MAPEQSHLLKRPSVETECDVFHLQQSGCRVLQRNAPVPALVKPDAVLTVASYRYIQLHCGKNENNMTRGLWDAKEKIRQTQTE
jgi:hypothetical protein